MLRAASDTHLRLLRYAEPGSGPSLQGHLHLAGEGGALHHRWRRLLNLYFPGEARAGGGDSPALAGGAVVQTKLMQLQVRAYNPYVYCDN